MTKDNQPSVLRDGKLAWTGRPDARAFTPPLAGNTLVVIPRKGVYGYRAAE